MAFENHYLPRVCTENIFFFYFDWSFAPLIDPVVATTSVILSYSKIQNVDILVPANPGPPGKLPLNLLKRREIHSEFADGHI